MSRTILIAYAVLAALAYVTLASPAAALSCLRPTVPSSFALAQQSPLTYVMAVGRLTPVPGHAEPVRRDPPMAIEETVRAEFQGRLATLSGFDRPVTLPVSVELVCAGPWCASVPRDEVLLFLEKRGDAYTLLEGPCPRFALAASPEAEAAALSCLRGGRCADP